LRITAPVTDYIRESILTTQGDLAVRGAALVERLAAGIAGTYFQGKGAGVLPAYESSMPPLAFTGDLLFQSSTGPARQSIATPGYVLGVHPTQGRPQWQSLFNLLTTQGDLWVRGAADPQRIAAGLLDTYFKGQGAGVLPIYEKMALRDTGVKIGTQSSEATENITVSGVGFMPSVVIFVFSDFAEGNVNFGVGYGSATQHYCLCIKDDGVALGYSTADEIYLRRSVGNTISGRISSFNADGFVIAMTEVGDAQVRFIYLCLP